MTTLVVDGRNVQRSRWPNLTEELVVEGSRRWAAERELRPVIAFDGRAPDGSYEDDTLVVGTGAESADDWITRYAAELAERGEPYWLVTSDRELRRRAGTAAERILGGGTFAARLAEGR